MSLVKANTYQDASGGSNAVFSGVAAPTGSMGFRNRIINGDMRIDQRNAGASVTNGFAVDRFEFQENSGSAYTIQRSTTAPAGFINSVIVTVTTAASATAAQVNRIFQRVEGNNIADLGWGTANAQTVTLSFRVRSSLTGTYCVALVNGDATRSYVAEYTISAANTWETKTVTIAGDTSGTWATDNTSGVQVTFDLGGGSNYNTTAGAWAAGNYTRTTNQANFANTNGATFYITGVQLEAGSVASPFERRDYGRELMMCQRYAIAYGGTTGNEQICLGQANLSTSALLLFNPPVTMRTTPSLTVVSASGFSVNDTSVQNATSAVVMAGQASPQCIFFNATTSGLTVGRVVRFMATTTSDKIIFSSEL